MIKGIYEAHLPVSDLTESIRFYEKLGLELAFQNEKLAFLWIMKGESWIGLWKSDRVDLTYHPSIRHIAFRIEEQDLDAIKAWLEDQGIEIRTAFKMTPEQQPLVLPNAPYEHAAIYFEDPDGNSLELITLIGTNADETANVVPYEEWLKKRMYIIDSIKEREYAIPLSSMDTTCRRNGEILCESRISSVPTNRKERWRIRIFCPTSRLGRL